MNQKRSEKTFYITTPIYYVNDKPHIGHAYTTILADVLSRYHREAGENTFFLTGLDEHGQKVQQAAELKNISPQEHCDSMAPQFTDLWKKLHIKNDDFIRTTEKRHKKVVQSVLNKVWDSGDIYFDEYTGSYCVGCERFYTEKELENGQCPQHKIVLKKITEKNYFFKMSKYQDALIQYIDDNPGFLQPEHRKNEILGFLRQPLGDLCISRPKSRLNWGVDLPFDKDYVTYVWFDALLNYVTAPGYLSDPENFQSWWNDCIHLIGKDILMTHAVYWPTMLMAAEMTLPKTIFAHGWWLSGESKMSKSLGNVVDPLGLIDDYGVDPVRYYLMREMVLGQDASFTIESFIKRYNSDLANDFGNLLSRVSRLIEQNFDGIIPDPGALRSAEKDLFNTWDKTEETVKDLIEKFRINDAIEEILQFIRRVNKYMEDQAPWKLVKEDKTAGGCVLYTALECFRRGATLLHPIMPSRIDEIFAILGVENSITDTLKIGHQLKKHDPLFPRIDVSKQVKKGGGEEKETSTLSFKDFEKVELLTAEILEAENVEDADRLLKVKVKVGDEIRQLVAGIAKHYEAKDLIGKKVIIVANLEPATIRGVESQGMILAASKGKNLSLITVDDKDIPTGSKVF